MIKGWNNKFQIGRSRKKRIINEISADKVCVKNMFSEILTYDAFVKTKPAVQNLITAEENKLKHPPRTKENLYTSCSVQCETGNIQLIDI
jgi:hypothetical protein